MATNHEAGCALVLAESDGTDQVEYPSGSRGPTSARRSGQAARAGGLALLVLCATGCSHTRHFPPEYRDALVDGLNSQWQSLSDDNGSVQDLLTLIITYRKYRDQFGDDARVHRALRKYENALWFWDANFEFMAGQTESTGYYHQHGKFAGRGEPLIVGEALQANPDDRYEHSESNHVSLCALGSIRSVKDGFRGSIIQNVVGAPLTRTPPQAISITPLETYSKTDDAVRKYQQDHDPTAAIRKMLKLAACFISNPKHPLASAAVSEAVNAVLEARPMSLEGVGEAAASNVLKNELKRQGHGDLVEAAETAELAACAYRALQ